MREKKFTPGPWEINSLKPETNRVLDANSSDTPAFVTIWFTRREQELDANAHLIAAAPQLLEALEKLVEEYKMATGLLNYDDIEEISLAKQAIKKAYGEND